MNSLYLFMLIIRFTSLAVGYGAPKERLITNYYLQSRGKTDEQLLSSISSATVTQGVYNQYIDKTKISGTQPLCAGTCNDCGASDWKKYPYCTDYRNKCDISGHQYECARYKNYFPFMYGAKLLVSMGDISEFLNKCVVIGSGDCGSESIILKDCTSNSTRWSYGNSKHIIKAHGKCLDFKQYCPQLKNCDGSDAQKWYLDDYRITTFDKQRCLDVNNGSPKGGIIATSCDKHATYPSYIEFRAQLVTDISIDIVKKYAPIAYFDRRAAGYPMSGQTFIDDGCGSTKKKCQNTVLDSTSNPTYYRAFNCHNLIKISYWWFYGYQEPCFEHEGEHAGDWEHVVVNIDYDRLESVLYHQHSGYYTVGESRLELVNTHPNVYISKKAHGCYYNKNAIESDVVGGDCNWFYEYRNPKDESDVLYTQENLINLDGFDEEWIHSGNCPAGRCNVLEDMDVCNVGGCKKTGCYWRDCDEPDEFLKEVCIGIDL